MNCRTIQNQLLILEDPGRPPAEVRDHLRDCAGCRRWQERLLQIERHVPGLPVPAPQNRDVMIRQFLTETCQPANGTAAGEHALPPILSLESATAPLAKLIPRYRLYAALAVAAALFLLIFDGLMLLRPDHSGSQAKKKLHQDPFLARLLERDLRLAKAQTPRKRLETLVDLADDLQGQTRKLIRRAAADDIQNLAELFAQVVDEGIVRGAVSVPAVDRPQVLGAAAERLTRAGQDADRLALEVGEDSANALRLIAKAAQHGGDQLRTLMRE